MLRKILGVIAGAVTGIVTISLVQWIGHQVFPIPADIDPTDIEALASYMDRIPLASKLAVVVAWTLGPIVGGIVGGRIAQARWASWVPGGLTALGLVLNATMIPHPIWMLALGALGIAVGTFVADRASGAR